MKHFKYVLTKNTHLPLWMTDSYNGANYFLYFNFEGIVIYSKNMFYNIDP